MLKNRTSIPVLLILTAMLTSCSTTRLLNENQFLYKKTKITVQSDEGVKNLPDEDDLIAFTAPRPNKKFLGLLPVKLWAYNLAGDSVGEKGFRHWLKYKLGAEPVVFREYYIESSEKELVSALENMGFYHAVINSEKKKKNKKIKVEYTIDVEKPYSINNFTYPEVTDSLTAYMNKFREKSLVKEGKRYNLETLKQERQRIDAELKKEGFFYFNEDYLYFRLDTFLGNRAMKVDVKLKNEIPDNAGNIYFINDVYVHHENAINDIPTDTTFKEGIHHIFKEDLNLRTAVLRRSVFFSEGARYNEENYSRTLDALLGLGIFKFAEINFKEVETRDSAMLDVHIRVTQSVPKSVRAELELVTKSNDLTGPGINLNYRNRNLNRGAEVLVVQTNASYETQLTGQGDNLSAVEFGASARLEIPRLVFPLFKAEGLIGREFKPKTRYELGYTFWNRTKLLRANSVNFGYGYHWGETRTKNHELRPLAISYIRYSNLAERLRENEFYKTQFTNRLIVSIDYTFTFNNLVHQRRRTNTYFRFYSEFAGNTVRLLDRVLSDASSRTRNSGFLGVQYSQFARFYTDYRIYIKLGRGQKLVNRYFLGIGLPYGNSILVPYSKQFFAGGASSIRAFRYRSVGPGSYHPGDEGNAFGLNQTGDIKLESNLEYRFDITKILKGALFVDAGNVFLLKDEEQTPGGKFEWDSFAGEIGVGAGIGLRIDISLFVLRFDLAFPARVPYLPKGDRWVFDSIDVLDSKWRKNNLILNIAIGYPF